jgi:hypothetical protein
VTVGDIGQRMVGCTREWLHAVMEAIDPIRPAHRRTATVVEMDTTRLLLMEDATALPGTCPPAPSSCFSSDVYCVEIKVLSKQACSDH